MSWVRRGMRVASLICLTGVAFALPVRFDVSVDPNPLKASEFADVTIKALDENGQVFTDYDSEVWIDIEGADYTDPDITLPSNGIAFFEPADLGVKILSKGLTIKKPGTYTLTVSDVYETSLQGEVEVEVLADSTGPDETDLTVVSPLSGSTETDSSVMVIGTTSFPQTPVVILVDGEEVEQGLSDENGDFTLYMNGLEPGEHELTVNALDLEDSIVATEGPIPFTYEPSDENLFLGLEIQPSNEVMINEKVTFLISTADSVSTAMIKLGDGQSLPTQKSEDGLFQKQMSMGEAGSFPVDVILTANGNATTFEDVDTVIVKEDLKQILTVDYTPDTERSKVELTWTYTGTIDFFKVQYGTDRDNLRLSLTTSTPKGNLILAEPTRAYYAQVYPVDENGVVNGQPSEVITIDPLQELPPEPICGNGEIEAGEACDDGNTINGDGCSFTCRVEVVVPPTPICGNGEIEGNEACDDGNTINGDGCSFTCTVEKPTPPPPPQEQTCYPEDIQLKTEKVGERYYLTWNAIPNVEKYIIYRSDQASTSTNAMTVIGETQQTRYEYPFDPQSEADRWAWYAIEAVCDNGQRKLVGDMRQVKVGPEDTLLILFSFSLLAAVFVRMWRVS